jgi:hypothetical protein
MTPAEAATISLIAGTLADLTRAARAGARDHEGPGVVHRLQPRGA